MAGKLDFGQIYRIDGDCCDAVTGDLLDDPAEEEDTLGKLLKLELLETGAGFLGAGILVLSGGVLFLPLLFEATTHKPVDVSRIAMYRYIARRKLKPADDDYPFGYRKLAAIANLGVVVATIAMLSVGFLALPSGAQLITTTFWPSALVAAVGSFQVWTDSRATKVCEPMVDKSSIISGYHAHKYRDMANSAFLAGLGFIGIGVSLVSVPGIIVNTLVVAVLTLTTIAGLRGVNRFRRLVYSSFEVLTERNPRKIDPYIHRRVGIKFAEYCANNGLTVELESLSFKRTELKDIEVTAGFASDHELSDEELHNLTEKLSRIIEFQCQDLDFRFKVQGIQQAQSGTFAVGYAHIKHNHGEGSHEHHHSNEQVEEGSNTSNVEVPVTLTSKPKVAPEPSREPQTSLIDFLLSPLEPKPVVQPPQKKPLFEFLGLSQNVDGAFSNLLPRESVQRLEEISNSEPVGPTSEFPRQEFGTTPPLSGLKTTAAQPQQSLPKSDMPEHIVRQYFTLG